MSALAPPPWFIDEREEMRHLGGRDTLAICCREDPDMTPSIVAVAARGYEDGPSWTNARLIAAAPELLKALEALFVAWSVEVMRDDAQRRPDQMLIGKTAMAAILKAKGVTGA